MDIAMGEYRGSNPRSFLGYTKQISRGIYYLLAYDCTVRLEHEDDISVIDDLGNIVIVEQCKDISLKPVKYTSKEFLNTLYNWVLMYTVSSEKITDKTEFILFLENSNTLDKVLTNYLYADNSGADIEKLQNLILKINSKTKNIKEIIEFFAKNTKILQDILKRLKIERPKSQTDTETDILNIVLSKYAFLHENSEDFISKLYGWFIEKVNASTSFIEIKNSNFNEFKAKYFGYKEALKLPNKKDVIVNKDDEQEKFYVKQLHLVTDNNTILTAAMVDYLRYNNMIDSYLLQGKITQTDINEMYDDMVISWSENKEDIENKIQDEKDKGYALYKACIEDDLHLNGISFYDKKATARGAYNYIADKKGGIKIGWHPKYKEILGIKDE